jgi:hypothetical protein
MNKEYGRYEGILQQQNDQKCTNENHASYGKREVMSNCSANGTLRHRS